MKVIVFQDVKPHRLILPVIAAVVMAVLCLKPVEGLAEQPLRIGFSIEALGPINQNDALAAIKVFARNFAEGQGLYVEPQPILFSSFTEIEQALKKESVDCISMASRDFKSLQNLMSMDDLVVPVRNDSFTEEYVLVVNKKSNIHLANELEGHSLELLEGPRMLLALPWLESELQKAGVKKAHGFLSSIRVKTKLQDALLPVFFGKSDACLVTRKGFAAMAELNPQLMQQLTVVAESHEYVPVVFGFRRSYKGSVKNRIVQMVERWHTTVAGQQILTIFQADRLLLRPVDCMESTFALLDRHPIVDPVQRNTSQGHSVQVKVQ